MKLRVGNACWHAGHIVETALCQEAGFYDDEGLEVEVVHAKIYASGHTSSQPGGERYDEVGVVVPDMIRYGIDVIPDIHVRTPFAERVLGNDGIRIIGGWRNWWRGSVMVRDGIESIADLKGRTIGEWYVGGVGWMWWQQALRKAGLDPDNDVRWKIGYQYGSQRESWKMLLAGETDAAVVQDPYVSDMQERGFSQLVDFVKEHQPHGRPDRVTVARKDFIERNPELLKRYWRATIRGYQFTRIAPDNFPFMRYVEAKIRTANPDPAERTRPLRDMKTMPGRFHPIDGQVSEEGVWKILEEHQAAGTLDQSITMADVAATVDQTLVREAWDEVSQTAEVRSNLEKLQPVIERIGY